MISSKPIIKINNLNVTYFSGKPNEVRALKKINLEIFPGEFIIFFGPSGCGKSTLLYSIAGLEREITGDIFISEKNISLLDYKQLEELHQKKIGMVFQAYYLINSLSVVKNVLLPSMAIGGQKDEREKRALELLAHFGVDKQAYKYPNELSGGQQQRVAISRSLMNDPEIILADEPVGNLDSKAAEDVVSLLKELNRKNQKTVILVTHNPSILNIADRVFHIKDGELIKIEVNESADRPAAIMAPLRAESGGLAISKDLAVLERTFSNISGAVGNLLTPFKAKQIVTEVIAEMSDEEMGLIQKKVEGVLMAGARSENDTTLYKFLDDAIEKGGFGMNRIAAKNLAAEINEIIKYIRVLEKRDQDISSGIKSDSAIERIRNYLLRALDLRQVSLGSAKAMDEIIKTRLDNKLDRLGCNKKLDSPIKKGGAGLDKRTANKVARRLELLILGKYK